MNEHKLSSSLLPRSGRLVLEDGTVFMGEVFGAPISSDGEVVFNTGMVGYVESLTDPSYRGQILCLTYPLIGNYGVPVFEKGSERFESDRVQVRGLVVASYVDTYSHWEAGMSLQQWLERQGVVGLFGVDTRELTKTLREKGTMLGRIQVSEQANEPRSSAPFEPVNISDSVADPNTTDLVGEVSCTAPFTLPPLEKGDSPPPRVVVVDCGSKRSIIQELRRRGCETVVVPHDHDFSTMDCDGVMLSNGPGDPTMCTATIRHTAALLERSDPVPVAGICLGSQIMALAAGGRTFKLPYGHRSQNQPCREEGTEHCVITSQNHGYAVAPSSLPEGWDIWFRNLNDGTVEGIRHRELPFFAVQFHPEAAPGPTDSMGFFDRFMEVVQNG